MKLGVFVPVLVAALALAGSGAMAGTAAMNPAAPDHGGVVKLAAAGGDAARCSSLEAQFDGAIKSHGSAAKAAEAKSLRQEGGQLCASGKASEGVKKLEQALGDIGQKPMKAKN